jgi:hypothetical protein
MTGFTDADWGRHRDSIGVYVIKIHSGPVSWKSKGQSCVALSSTEAEYIAVYQAAKKESTWTVNSLKSLGISVSDHVVTNTTIHGVLVPLHFREKRISLNHLPTKEITADC